MLKRHTIRHWRPAAFVLLAASAVWAGEGEVQLAGCNCGRGGGGGVMPLAPSDHYMPPAMGSQPMLLPVPQGPHIPSGPVSPPPGTLGRTYELPTRLVPADKHPRTGMLKVRVASEDVLVSHTNEFREEDDVKGFQDETDPALWHFETRPLLPGIPHVYKVEAINGGKTTSVRYVRMIPGRILELTF